MHTIQPIPLAVFADQLLSLYRSVGRRPMTISRMAQVLAELSETLGPSGTTADLTTLRIAAWLAKDCRERNPNTTIGYLGYLKAACSWAIE